MVEFLKWASMGGYGGYVWAAYGITFLILGAFAIYLVRHLRKAQRTLQRLKAASSSEDKAFFHDA